MDTMQFCAPQPYSSLEISCGGATEFISLYGTACGSRNQQTMSEEPSRARHPASVAPPHATASLQGSSSTIMLIEWFSTSKRRKNNDSCSRIFDLNGGREQPLLDTVENHQCFIATLHFVGDIVFFTHTMLVRTIGSPSSQDPTTSLSLSNHHRQLPGDVNVVWVQRSRHQEFARKVRLRLGSEDHIRHPVTFKTLSTVVGTMEGYGKERYLQTRPIAIFGGDTVEQNLTRTPDFTLPTPFGALPDVHHALSSDVVPEVVVIARPCPDIRYSHGTAGSRRSSATFQQIVLSALADKRVRCS
ncbi:uncharacterized protein BT62DRAFT_1075687 [Guyanagaster necrorhizus]|uniref:Uncharacterized protein n=1 Tax=Guyanagaster necrorhizus TaxID=856835 RepID=A0A9P7VW38_9AGAR|nr:uncharacterized protein BT62DRAFT_1075687 [Guyanagaster necrorhizus MCA 3950]KAG7446951.1 hypothetical protein BT62DRAFT_1075687 [Guyanagaster necrorhizus MCA 3950]